MKDKLFDFVWWKENNR